MIDKFIDRTEAGDYLAKKLISFKNHPDTLIIALPRGGVPVAFQLAKQLHLPLDVWIVRKLGLPEYEELAFGALTSGNITIFNEDILQYGELNQHSIDAIIEKEQIELERRQKIYRGQKPLPRIHNKSIILVDDGIATGATMLVAIKALHQLKPKEIIVAVPVAAADTVKRIAKVVDQVVTVLTPKDFKAVGEWYVNFSQTTDAEVCHLLKESKTSQDF